MAVDEQGEFFWITGSFVDDIPMPCRNMVNGMECGRHPIKIGSQYFCPRCGGVVDQPQWAPGARLRLLDE